MRAMIPCPFCDDRFGATDAVGLDMSMAEHVRAAHGTTLPQHVREQIYREWPDD